MKLKTKIKLIVCLSACTIAVTGLASCSEGSNTEFKFTSTVPTKVLYGNEIYFREYVPFEYGADYKLYASYYDYEKEEQVTKKLQESTLFLFDKVTDYTFKLVRTIGKEEKELTCSVACYPEISRLSESTVWLTSVGEEIVLNDLLFWCGLTLTNEQSATADTTFKWEYESVTINATSVEGGSELVDLSNKTETSAFVFEEEGLYEFNLKATNKSGSTPTVLKVNTASEENHKNEVSGYVFTDKQEVVFTMPAEFKAPADQGKLPVRVGNTRYEATYDATRDEYTVSNFTNALTGEERLYITSADAQNFSTLIVVPDLIVTQDNVKELALIKEGNVVLREDIDMSLVKNYFSARTGNKYQDYYFKGLFDGRGYTISNFTAGTATHAGALFWSSDGAVFKNFTMTNAETTTNNGVLCGRTMNGVKFENIAIHVSKMATAGAGICSTATERNIVYKNVLLIVDELKSANVTTAGVFGGVFARSMSMENVYVVTDTTLPLYPQHATLVTAVEGAPEVYTTEEAATELVADEMPTGLLSKAVSFLLGD